MKITWTGIQAANDPNTTSFSVVVTNDSGVTILTIPNEVDDTNGDWLRKAAADQISAYFANYFSSNSFNLSGSLTITVVKQ